jgi:hypothetical protein
LESDQPSCSTPPLQAGLAAVAAEGTLRSSKGRQVREGESSEVIARVLGLMETSEGIYGWKRRHREDFEAKVKSSMPSLQRNAGKICSFFQKDTLKYAA